MPSASRQTLGRPGGAAKGAKATGAAEAAEAEGAAGAGARGTQPLGQALLRRAEVDAARARVEARGLRLSRDPLKAWDMDLLLARIEATVPRGGRVLDVGCMDNPLLANLATLGYRDLWGADLLEWDMSGLRAPAIQYVRGDLLRAPFPDGSFDAITSLSVMEHGCPPRAYVEEAARLLRPGGRLLTTTDFWTSGVRSRLVRRRHTFGLPWIVQTPRRLERLRRLAEGAGLRAVGPWDYGVEERPVQWCGRRYTFFAFELVKPAAGA